MALFQRKYLWLSLLLLTGGVLLPQPAHAWGPAVHFHLAGRLLEMGLMAGALAEVLLRHRPSFLYGSVVADVVLGKDFVEDEHHSHNWSMARDLREAASSDREHAFAAGVWMHLAADTLAHNNFVPHHHEQSIAHERLSHVYWEIRAENWVPGPQRRELKDLLQEDFEREEQLLESTIAASLLPFPVNWAVFKGLLRVAALEPWHHLSRLPSRVTRRPLPSRTRESYLEVSVRRMAGSMGDDETRERILAMDPTGGS